MSKFSFRTLRLCLISAFLGLAVPMAASAQTEFSPAGGSTAPNLVMKGILNGKQVQSTTTVPINAASIPGGNPTYRMVGTGYTAYATPTDLFCISGSATKTIGVTWLYMQVQTTSSGIMQTIYYVKRSTTNAGGTSTTPSPVVFDSAGPNATAVVRLYTAAPTTGTLAGTLNVHMVNSVTLTTGGATNSVGGFAGVPSQSVLDYRRPIILHGTGESVCVNYGAAALTAGFTAVWGVEWFEY